MLLTNVPRRLDPPPPETHPRTLYVSRASFIQATCVLRPRRPRCVLAANRRFTGFTRGGCGYKRCDPNVCASVPCAWPDSRVTSYEGNPPTKLPSFQKHAQYTSTKVQINQETFPGTRRRQLAAWDSDLVHQPRANKNKTKQKNASIPPDG